MALIPAKRSLLVWRLVQLAVWFMGMAIVLLLIFRPSWGVMALWNILIPVAPMLLVFAPGLWRNICPLASTALVMRHSGRSARRIMSHHQRIIFNCIGVFLLLTIVPLRHVMLDTEGRLTGFVLLGVGVVSMIMGSIYEWKSGWCSGLCPVHPVEKLYGSKPLVTTENAHCETCQRCVGPCPDSTDRMHSMIGPPWRIQRWMDAVMVGGFPGFVWGWFHVPDNQPETFLGHLVEAYTVPLTAGLVTFLLFVILRPRFGKSDELLLARVFAAAAVSCYYWFRVPMLVGLGMFPQEGALIDLSEYLGDGFILASHVATAGLFVWWLLIHQGQPRHWATRPAYAVGVESLRAQARKLSHEHSNAP